MRFSLLIEIQIDSPTPEKERQAVLDAVDHAVLADELGYHCVWAVEHHGLIEYSHCSAPEVVLAFIAARTQRIRIGHAVSLTAHRYNHPIRVAERVAMLDILSAGRVNWGSGKSASRTEQGAFEIDPSELDSQWREAIEMIPRMWRSDVFEWQGRHFKIPPTAILPKPVQRPHPPIYVACSRPETVTTAGTLGAGSLNFSAGDDAMVRAKVQLYRDAISATSVTSRRINNQFCSTPATLVLEDDRKACEYGYRGARFFAEGLGTYFFSPQRYHGPLEINRGPLTADELRTAMAARNTPGAQLATIIGNPEVARTTVQRFVDTGVDELILVMQMGTIPNDIVLESIRTFAGKVMPYFS
jgi:alkanesulfonate monooxygenase SsuD/methylene tetrahydromethanopterin reductase-like flavin-dependent oxidoreductase (luciferase family)